VLRLQPERAVAGDPPLGAWRDQAAAADARERRERDVALDRKIHHEPLLASVLRNEPDTGRHRRSRRAGREPPALDLDRARVPPVDTEDRARDLGPARADEAGQTDDLAAPHVRGHIRAD